ncbi:MAG: DegT/DnrJ/EryC1/StrS family aminotransferase [Saprospiraceae bacterium]
MRQSGFLSGCKHVIPCANGTDALQIALMALELKPGDEVVTCPFTSLWLPLRLSHLGLKPVFVDVDPTPIIWMYKN